MAYIFRLVSGIFNPMLLPFFGAILFFQAGSYGLYSFEYKLYIQGIVLLNTGLLPGLGIWMLKKYGYVSDMNVTVRKERVIPYIIILVTYSATIALLIRLQVPWLAVKLYFGVLLAIFLAFFITLKWKISAHTMSFGCLVASSFIVCLNQGISPLVFFVILLLLAGLQATSRVYLKAHTLGQVGGGFLLGIVSICTTYYLIP
jgi:membrane-associated phospholipid phosphatase